MTTFTRNGIETTEEIIGAVGRYTVILWSDDMGSYIALNDSTEDARTMKTDDFADFRFFDAGQYNNARAEARDMLKEAKGWVADEIEDAREEAEYALMGEDD